MITCATSQVPRPCQRWGVGMRRASAREGENQKWRLWAAETRWSFQEREREKLGLDRCGGQGLGDLVRARESRKQKGGNWGCRNCRDSLGWEFREADWMGVGWGS